MMVVVMIRGRVIMSHLRHRSPESSSCWIVYDQFLLFIGWIIRIYALMVQF